MFHKARKMAQTSDQLLASHLRAVSRWLYATVRVLPPSIRPQISLACLLARTADTIADTQSLPLDERLAALQQLRERIQGSRQDPLDFSELVPRLGSPAERLLLENCEASLSVLPGFSPVDIELFREVLTTIIGGQELDLHRFAGSSAAHIKSLQTDAELDDFIYRVAGCVGEFWTRFCRARFFPQVYLKDSWLVAQGVRFGKGLRLVHILRDLAADLRRGRCYLPAARLASCSLNPADLLRPGNEPRLRPVYNDYLTKADFHLQAGWAYTNALPRGSIRVRLACAWHILIGQETLKLLWRNNVLDPQRRINVSQGRIRRVMLRSVLLYPWQGAWRRLVS